jgi:hypothetical protein
VRGDAPRAIAHHPASVGKRDRTVACCKLEAGIAYSERLGVAVQESAHAFAKSWIKLASGRQRVEDDCSGNRPFYDRSISKYEDSLDVSLNFGTELEGQIGAYT